jgi:hypothetical protein
MTASPALTLDGAIGRATSDAVAVGRDLAATGVTLARDTARLVWDVGEVVRLALGGLARGTASAASSMVRDAEALSMRPTPRKPLATAAGRARSQRRRASA